MDVADQPRLLPCGHTYCRDCLAPPACADPAVTCCPQCRCELPLQSALDLPPIAAPPAVTAGTSTKLTALIAELRLLVTVSS